MKNYSNFFERIGVIISEEGYSSINDFALNGLKYKSSEKLNRLKDPKKKPSIDIVMDISNKFGYSSDWLLFGEGSKEKDHPETDVNLKNEKRKIRKMPHFKRVTKGVTFPDETKSTENATLLEGVPLIPLDAMAGFGEGEVQVMDYETERYVVPEFEELHVHFMIRVKGSSMYPKYNSGDLVACRKLSLTDVFFQWNKVYVLDTAQGPLVKRIRKATKKNHILIVSDNEKYDPFELPLSEVNAIALVVGVIRLE